MKKDILFIVNPFSGTSNKEDFERSVDLLLHKERFDYKIVYTEAPLHGKELAKEAVADNIDIVASVGGDGTVNEIASQLVHSHTSLAIVPGGSGNGLANHLGISRKIKKAIQNINNGEQQLIDSCTLNDQFFINVGGIGFDAKVSHMLKKDKKRGFQAYFRNTFKELSRFKSVEAHIEIPELNISKTSKYAFMAVSNGSMYGYNFAVCPPAHLDDGIMDVLLLKDNKIVKYLLSSYKALTKTIHKSKLVEYYQCKEINITTEPNQFYHIDGEAFLSKGQHHFRINPKSIRILLDKDKRI